MDLDLLKDIKSGQRRPSLITRLVSGWKPPHVSHNNVDILQVQHRFTAIISDNFVELYEIEQTEDGTVRCQLQHEVQTPKNVILAATNWNPYAQNNSRTYLVVGMEGLLYLYTLDLKTKHLVKKSDISVRDVRTISFMGENRFLLMTQGNQLIKYDCSSGSFYRRLTIKVNLSDPVHGSIISSHFLSNMSEETDEPFYYLFVTRIVDNDDGSMV